MQASSEDRLTILGTHAAVIVGAALFPRLAYWARWPTRLGVRGLLAYATFNALLMFAIRQYALPWMKRMAEQWERVEADLRQQLGREPTEDEIFEHFSRPYEA